jgi:hypothetical protein
MLTRAAVAKRLGRSITTVRRMEGNELHPWTDSRGVHQFDDGEVERLARCALGRDAARDPSGFDEDGERRDVGGNAGLLELELDQARESVRRLSERTTLLESRNQELRTTGIEALELVEVVLGSETPFVVQHCLRQLKRQA